MAGFKDYRGTPFVPYLLPIIPRGEPLSPDSKLTQGKLGKIPGLRNPDTGLWSGFDWTNFKVYERSLEIFSGWYAGRPCETIAINARELIAIDVDADNAVVADIVEEVALFKLGITAKRVRDGTHKFLLCYRLAAGSPPVTKARDVVQDHFETRYPVEILGLGQQWLMEGEHPSGSNYRWAHGMRPVDIGWADITQVTNNQVQAFRAALRARLAEAGFMPAAARRLAAGSSLPGERHPIGPDHPDVCPDMALLARALAMLPCDDVSLADYDDWMELVIALKTASAGSETFYEEHVVPWASAVPDNIDLLREKWESVDEASLGWDYVASAAQAHGFTEHIQAGFEDLPPISPAGPHIASDFGRRLADSFAKEHGRVDHAFVPETQVWRKSVDGIWGENHSSLWDIGAHCEANARAILSQPGLTKEQVKRAEGLCSTGAAEAVRRYVREHPAIIVPKREFDSHPLLMGVPGGYIDEKGDLRDPDPGLLITRQALIRPDHSAVPTLFNEFVARLANYDKDNERALQMLLGYTLCGLGTEQVFVFLRGAKGNEGKSQFLRTLYLVMGGYATRVATETFMNVTGSRRDFDLSDLDGCWFAYASELERYHSLAEGRLKMATGGDGMHVEAKYQHGRNVETRFGLWFAANRWPQISDADGALRRRAAIFECLHPLTGIEVSDYSHKLVEAEGPAILAQLLRWRADYLRDGLHWSKAMLLTRDIYFNTSDKVRNFLMEEGVFDPVAVEKKIAVYNRYRGWCQEAGVKSEGRNEFYRRLEEHEVFRGNGCEFVKTRITPGREHSPIFMLRGWRLRGFEVVGTQEASVEHMEHELEHQIH